MLPKVSIPNSSSSIHRRRSPSPSRRARWISAIPAPRLELYSLAGQGALKIIAAASREAPGFRVNGIVASNRAYDAGLRSLKDLGGHSIAISQFGSPPHYSLVLIEDKYGVDAKSIRLAALQSNPNILSALTGGTIDASVMLAAAMMPAVGRGEMHLLAFVGDETAWQTGVVFTATKTANDRHEMVGAS